MAGRTRIYTFNPRYTFLDETRELLAKAMANIGFITDGLSPRYFIHTDCQWSVEFPTAPLAIGHEHIQSEQVAALETDAGTIRLLSRTDSIKDRLLWWYLEQDPQSWEQSLDVARNHKVNWADLKKWHAGEGYADEFETFKQAV
ncbi:hypothetical protein F0M18_00700 [Pseudohalioglobus sediminis]|uniref:Uncharacterized protein n=1 Tax=Pseudohalioglobus sediminis TaxID=2606449 RepID=A0A5B0X663_9GAMM|nr:hypothetical protein [Pseudohalioglobus sediminis]KAA1193997.1 hypothetical protein F0M18_00700 [Pseudohalioglobus sediminis]